MYVCMYPRTKLPKLSQPTHSDEETRERDQLMKFKSKQYADAARNARMSEVKQGDLVLMKQDKNKHLNLSCKKWKRRKEIRLLCLIATIPRGFCTETQLKSSSTTLLMISSVIRRLIRRKTPLPLQLRWTQQSNHLVLISRKVHQGVIRRGFANHLTDWTYRDIEHFKNYSHGHNVCLFCTKDSMNDFLCDGL